MLHMIIVGNLGKDAEVKALQDGTNVINFSVCHNNKKKEGDQWVDDPVWVSVSKFVPQGGSVVVAQHLKKGTTVSVSGLPSIRQWTGREGQSGVSWELRAYEIGLHGGAQQTAPQQQQPQTQQNYQQPQQQQGHQPQQQNWGPPQPQQPVQQPGKFGPVPGGYQQPQQGGYQQPAQPQQPGGQQWGNNNNNLGF